MAEKNLLREEIKRILNVSEPFFYNEDEKKISITIPVFITYRELVEVIKAIEKHRKRTVKGVNIFNPQHDFFISLIFHLGENK